MPQKKSAMKRLKQDKKKQLRNKVKVSAIRTLAKKVITLIAAKDKDNARSALQHLESKMDKAVKTKSIKRNAASRKISRLSKQISKL